jgi:hypothetical protein
MAAAEECSTAATAAAVGRLPADVAAALPDLVELLANPPVDAVWLPWAACRGMDQAGFFPDGHGKQRLVAKARATCETCPVRWECLADILRWEPRSHRFGIVGGLNGRERALVAKVVAP